MMSEYEPLARGTLVKRLWGHRWREHAEVGSEINVIPSASSPRFNQHSTIVTLNRQTTTLLINTERL